MSAEGFEWVWQNSLKSDGGTTLEPTPAIKQHLEKMYEQACVRPPSKESLEAAIADVLRCLDTETGGTVDNRKVVSSFIMPGDEFWEEDWEELPDHFVEILGIMGHELWQAAEDPEWAESYGGTPKQILQQLAAGPVSEEG